LVTSASLVKDVILDALRVRYGGLDNSEHNRVETLIESAARCGR
jgi:hypothetical protein